jgi:hemoglobin-like flavoprotein
MSLDLEALETSFDLIAPRGDELMDVFYARLFAAAPSVRPLFPEDMARQKTMLLGALVLLRKSLRDLDAIVPKLRALGARHVGYGAVPEHYPVVGEVLIAPWDMEILLGRRQPPSVTRYAATRPPLRPLAYRKTKRLPLSSPAGAPRTVPSAARAMT